MSESQPTEYKRILAIDYGEKRIGTALSDPLKIFSYPFKTLLNDDSIWDELRKLILEQNVFSIVLGIPSDEGNPSSIRNKILKFKLDLENNFKLEVKLWDETFTSVIAFEKVLESVNKKSKRRDKGLIDNNSAAIILQEFLEKLKK